MSPALPEMRGMNMAFAVLDRIPSRSKADRILAHMRRLLDAIYVWSAYLAAASLVILLLLTLMQIIFRYAHITVTGLSDYGGYFMASSAFLAFAHALNRGVHVRIELIHGLVGRFRYPLEATAFGLGTAISGWFAYYACRMVVWSYKFGDISTGLDATPLWIPQLAMAFGSVLFAVAIADQWLQLIFRGAHTIPASENPE
jgi:TRAP-type C4-dicarboxylate transport system permease small subunit